MALPAISPACSIITYLKPNLTTNTAVKSDSNKTQEIIKEQALSVVNNHEFSHDKSAVIEQVNQPKYDLCLKNEAIQVEQLELYAKSGGKLLEFLNEYRAGSWQKKYLISSTQISRVRELGMLILRASIAIDEMKRCSSEHKQDLELYQRRWNELITKIIEFDNPSSLSSQEASKFAIFFEHATSSNSVLLGITATLVGLWQGLLDIGVVVVPPYVSAMIIFCISMSGLLIKLSNNCLIYINNQRQASDRLITEEVLKPLIRFFQEHYLINEDNEQMERIVNNTNKTQNLIEQAVPQVGRKLDSIENRLANLTLNMSNVEGVSASQKELRGKIETDFSTATKEFCSELTKLLEENGHELSTKTAKKILKFLVNKQEAKKYYSLAVDGIVSEFELGDQVKNALFTSSKGNKWWSDLMAYDNCLMKDSALKNSSDRQAIISTNLKSTLNQVNTSKNILEAIGT